MLIRTKQLKMTTSIANIQNVTMQWLPWMHTILLKVLLSSQTHPNLPIFWQHAHNVFAISKLVKMNWRHQSQTDCSTKLVLAYQWYFSMDTVDTRQVQLVPYIHTPFAICYLYCIYNTHFKFRFLWYQEWLRRESGTPTSGLLLCSLTGVWKG